MRPVPVPNRINEAMKLHHRGSLQPLSMWTADTVVESESDGEEELVERLASEISIINLASSEHEDWSPFPSKQTLYALLICQNPRHIMSVQHQQMILSFVRAAVHSYAKGARQDGVPSQKALEVCRRQLRATLDAPPLKEISSGSGNIFFCSSIAAAIARDFANPSARSAMVFYPRQTATIGTFQDAAFFHTLAGTLSEPCVVTPNGSAYFVEEVLSLNDGRAVVADRWVLKEGGNVFGDGYRADNAAPLQRQERVEFAWNPHIQLSFQNGALTPSELVRETNLYLFAVTNSATSLELMAEFVVQLKICKYGGTKAYKNSAEGLKTMFKIGPERTSADTIDALSGLVKIAVEGKSTEYFSHQSSSGAKDVIVEEVTDILFELRRILSGKVPSHPRTPARKQTKADILQDVQTEATALQSCEWYNALLTLSDVCGFAVHAQSPVECLHTLWLGPVKYLAIATVHMMDKRPASNTARGAGHRRSRMRFCFT
ncbi:unnamed protein product, partial [Tilletia controversa]